MKTDDRTLTIKEIARFLNISNQMVYNLIRDRKIEAFKVGSTIRVLHSDLQEYIDRQKREFIDFPETPAAPEEGLFLVNNLNFHREEFQLRNISFSFPRGKILTILGSSGSGKTMLLKTIAGLNRTESGAVFLGSRRLDELDVSERNLGFVFEDYALMPHRDGRGNIRFPLETQGKKKAEIDPAVETVARELNLSPEDLKSYVHEMPEGIKQLTAIARADVRNIDLLLMDEPLARLDKNIRMRMRVFLKELVAGIGTTTILTLHEAETALALSDYMAVLDKGRLVQFGEAQEVYKNPAAPVVFELTSRFAVNKLDVTVTGGEIGDFSLPAAEADGDYRLYFRADEVRVTEEGIPAAIRRRHVVDGSRILADCESERGGLELILPAQTDEKFRFTPTRYSLFR